MWRRARRQRLLFFLGGLFFSTICGVTLLFWMSIVPYSTFDQQPAWLKDLRRLVEWLPWIAVAVVIIIRLFKDHRVRVGFYFLGTLTPIVVLVGWLILGPFLADLIHRQEFDAELWRNHENVAHDIMWPPRLRMVDNLMSSGRLNNRTRAEVVRMLGEPTEEIYFPGWDMVYWLGPERGFMGIDYEWLVLRLRDNGSVAEYQIVTD